MKKTIVVETTKEIITCDIGECEQTAYCKCSLCGKDLCWGHTVHMDHNLHNGEYDDGDYQDRCCGDCSKLFNTEYLPRYRKIHDEIAKFDEKFQEVYSDLKNRFRKG